jgi:glycosyltransferase involved in cell wall biosynthesis
MSTYDLRRGMQPGPRPRLMVVTTVPVTAWTVMCGKLRFLNENGFEVVLVSSPTADLQRTAEREGVRAVGVPMNRGFRPWADVVSLVRLFRLMRAERPHVMLAGTPKAGLVASLAGAMSRVPVRVYLMLGLRLETARGAARGLLWLAEWVSTHVVHRVLVVSPSLLARARDIGVLGDGRGVVLGHGGGNGVDVGRFAATPDTAAAAAAARAGLGIPANAFVYGFVGRLTADKGLRELVAAFDRIAACHPDAWLLVVGAEDLGGLPPGVRTALRTRPRVRCTGWQDDPTAAYHVMDALVLPTYREGFPTVSLEAAAAGKPVITTTATGAVDSVVDGTTGLLVPPRDADALATAMARLIGDRQAARDMGARGRCRVRRSFANEVAWGHVERFIKDLV